MIFIKAKQKAAAFSAEAAGDIILGALVRRGGKQLLAGGVLYDLTKQEEGGGIAYAHGLLHIMRYDDYSIIVFKTQRKLFDFPGGYGVKSAGGLVHKQHLGLHGQCARYA